ncbi:acetyl-CoA C-acyltransferase [Microbulbifer sp. OS29]|uniref:Acetyl-CoA C-acyltransferase n=1 Tax=Microbulbifer okhotskensis TaxID=2926617 RepID=A0A9X2J5K9_9GAMM|nr:acetyl-CoA C-acyltransferase [Microbulbifer okhotskensis]MCO1335652.1 acetyl-CoA C-acyltransferase [Microbulbifer okhotskensis]
MSHAYIYDGGRSAFGRHGGNLSSVRPDNLLAHVIRTLVERNNFKPQQFEDIIAGNTNQAGEDSRNIARFAGLLAGLPISTGGITINRLCGSGLSAIADAARCIQVSEGELFIAGGVESMSRAPLVLSKANCAFDRSQEFADTTLGPRFTNPDIVAQFGCHTMPQTADNIAADLHIQRNECDAFAVASQAKYKAARADGFFIDEIIPIEVTQGGKQPPRVIATDEHPRPSTTLARLQSLPPLFEGSGVTAGNASGINDGAAALIMGNLEAGQIADLKPRARILASAIAGVEPRVMGLGPVLATRKALARAGLTLADMEVMEFNEAFAVQAMGCLKMLEINYEDSRVNSNGGAIAVGHPLAASGVRILLTALRQLERTGGRYGLATMCIGIGQGIAVIIERI